MTLSTTQCATIAKLAHKGQKYGKLGYFEGHVQAVVDELGPKASEAAKQIAYLHDVVEDTAYTLSDLQSLGVDQHVLECLLWLTRDKDESYAEYIKNIITKAPYRAALVKMADLRVNLRMSEKTRDEVAPGAYWEEAIRRVQKYELALLVFDTVGYTLKGFDQIENASR